MGKILGILRKWWFWTWTDCESTFRDNFRPNFETLLLTWNDLEEIPNHTETSIFCLQLGEDVAETLLTSPSEFLHNLDVRNLTKLPKRLEESRTRDVHDICRMKQYQIEFRMALLEIWDLKFEETGRNYVSSMKMDCYCIWFILCAVMYNSSYFLLFSFSFLDFFCHKMLQAHVPQKNPWSDSLSEWPKTKAPKTYFCDNSGPKRTATKALPFPLRLGWSWPPSSTTPFRSWKPSLRNSKGFEQVGHQNRMLRSKRPWLNISLSTVGWPLREAGVS